MIIGATILVSILTFALSQIQFIPIWVSVSKLITEIRKLIDNIAMKLSFLKSGFWISFFLIIIASWVYL